MNRTRLSVMIVILLMISSSGLGCSEIISALSPTPPSASSPTIPPESPEKTRQSLPGNMTPVSPSPALSPSPTVKTSVPGQPLGSVAITYTLRFRKGNASNQIAVWIEDENGKYIRGIFATHYAATEGYIKRPECLPLWIQTSAWPNAPKKEIDAVTGATQKPGVITLTWDCKDRNGQPVKPGKYMYVIEGNIFWADRVVWRGEINVGDEENTSLAQVEYIPPTAIKTGILVENVSAAYTPAKLE